MPAMQIFDAIILGIVEGLTEYLPVSSTGHLIITRFLLGMQNTDAQKAFDICIQSGAILAVLGIYFQRVKGMARDTLTWLADKERGHHPLPDGLRLLLNMLIAFIPAVVLGLIFDDLIKHYLFDAPVVTLTWALGGLVILLYVRAQKKKGIKGQGKALEELTYKNALTVGLMQCIAMCPGVSRSLVTMLGGLCTGLSMAAAVEFSFLLGLITLSGATVYDACKHGGEMVAAFGWWPIIVGTFTAWLSSVIAVKWMVGYLNKHSLAIFGWYRLAAALVMLALILFADFKFN